MKPKIIKVVEVDAWRKRVPVRTSCMLTRGEDGAPCRNGTWSITSHDTDWDIRWFVTVIVRSEIGSLCTTESMSSRMVFGPLGYVDIVLAKAVIPDHTSYLWWKA